MDVRFIKNVKVKIIDHDGQERQQKFMFGETYAADQIEIVQEGYITILLRDGTIIPGITSDVIENYGVPIVVSNTSEPATQEVEEVETNAEPEVGTIPMNGTMLGKDEV